MTEISDTLSIKKAVEASGYLSLFSFDISPYIHLFTAQPGEPILSENQTTDGMLYYLVKGRAKLTLSLPNGKSTLIDFLTAPCFIGEMELIEQRQTTLGVRALEVCTLLGVPFSQCKEPLLRDCRFLVSLCQYIAQKERRKTDNLSRMSAYPLRNRLADFILTASCRDRYKEGNKDASDYLGVSYRHLQYTMKQFTEQGLIKKESRGYTVTNRSALEELSRQMRG